MYFPRVLVILLLVISMITNCYSVDVSSKTNSAYDEATKDLEKFLGSLKLKKSTVKNDVANRSRILRVIESHVAS
ncbi:hypothetical protein Pmar_PMAR016953 [Perkinsus marinus ATCC 50983]|uniref:Uncharacterized protein n=1 Tax=Perkinsus marinus (strain ATCC 50983 / TXsc) TaxID=423536 RepID=C5KW53_PERM5|nr:hypothetical protein Pmar_PMAR016953 [Perkinsus marinus ATCC 50983]EER11290.1 hypothetical protein Pmar_PMAR016953 [Perkinsus marinus ATCC 50983]|eukprot:XP_002779495.1 hypothetical protein Pmar_PMAR016953 [Perkinsus marinus ATCC 50983]